MGFFQARMLEWVAISFPRGSSLPRDQTCNSCGFFTWAIAEAQLILYRLGRYSVQANPFSLRRKPLGSSSNLVAKLWLLAKFLKFQGNTLLPLALSPDAVMKM